MFCKDKHDSIFFAAVNILKTFKLLFLLFLSKKGIFMIA